MARQNPADGKAKPCRRQEQEALGHFCPQQYENVGEYRNGDQKEYDAGRQRVSVLFHKPVNGKYCQRPVYGS